MSVWLMETSIHREMARDQEMAQPRTHAGSYLRSPVFLDDFEEKLSPEI